MDARTRWTVLTGAFATALIVLEADALREPLTDEKPSGTYTAWWRWLLGLQPVHKRRWVAAGVFTAFWAWFVGHICLAWPPNDLPRRGHHVGSRLAATNYEGSRRDLGPPTHHPS